MIHSTLTHIHFIDSKITRRPFLSIFFLFVYVLFNSDGSIKRNHEMTRTFSSTVSFILFIYLFMCLVALLRLTVVPLHSFRFEAVTCVCVCDCECVCTSVCMCLGRPCIFLYQIYLWRLLSITHSICKLTLIFSREIGIDIVDKT